MNSKLLLALLVLALAGTTWLLVTLVSLPPMGDAPTARDTSAVADGKAVVNPFAPPAPDGGADSTAADSTAADSAATDSTALDEASLDSTTVDRTARGATPDGARP